MAIQCSKCAKKIGMLDNQGSSTNPLCYECANSKIECMKCKNEIVFINSIIFEGQNICKNCHQTILNENSNKIKMELNEELSSNNQQTNAFQSKSNEIIITDIKMSFSSLISFLIKFAFASIPALIVVTITISIIIILIFSLLGISLSNMVK